MCTFKNVIKNLEVNVDVLKGVLMFKGKKIDNRCASCIQFIFFIHYHHIVIAFNNYPIHSC